MTKKFLKKLPGSLRLSSDYLVICQHKAYSCCDICTEKYPNIVKTLDGCVWVNNQQEVDEFVNWYNTEMIGA